MAFLSIFGRFCFGLPRNCQNHKGLLGLPYEVLFEVAHYLTPEDLLVARATCHKVNNMLRAESARFWLHASLRRKFRDANQRNSSTRNASASARGDSREQRRSLVFEAIRMLLPKLFRTGCAVLPPLLLRRL